MAERHVLDLPNGTRLDVTAVPLQSFDDLRVQVHPNGFVLHFLRKEEPYPVCLGRFGIPRGGIVGLIAGLVAVARDAGIALPNVFDQDKDEGPRPAH